jgi:hypothetical protein
METTLERLFKRISPKEIVNSREYMPRVHDVRAPCQWLEHCYDGKCPAFVRLNGNFYCARKINHT